MLQLTAKHKVFIGIQPIDFRRGIDAIAGHCSQIFQKDPLSGHVFVFRNRKLQSIKLLVYDSQGFWLCQKRLSRGKFNWWPTSEQRAMELSISQLNNLIWNDKPTALVTETWKSIDHDE